MYVLLAEDDSANRSMIQQILEHHGHRVAFVDNGREAVEAADHTRFDAILMDIQMPVMDGFAATAEIRKKESSKSFRTPIVAFNSIDFGEIFSQAGMDAYLPKPPNSGSVLAVLSAVTACNPH